MANDQPISPSFAPTDPRFAIGGEAVMPWITATAARQNAAVPAGTPLQFR